MAQIEKKFVPHVTTALRKDFVHAPDIIKNSSGIIINGKRLKSIMFTTDISVIMNNNADAILAVYPFTPHSAIIEAITTSSNLPVLAGVGGGTTKGRRSGNMALFAESHGCSAVVVNAPTQVKTIRTINEYVDIPIIMTVVSEYTEIQPLLDAGIDILNVSGGKNTEQIVRSIKRKFPNLPVIATGGPTNESIQATIEAGANAISYTPPSNGDLFSKKMQQYRDDEKDRYDELQDLQ